MCFCRDVFLQGLFLYGKLNFEDLKVQLKKFEAIRAKFHEELIKESSDC